MSAGTIRLTCADYARVFRDMGHRLGLTEKHVTVDNFFAEYIAS